MHPFAKQNEIAKAATTDSSPPSHGAADQQTKVHFYCENVYAASGSRITGAAASKTSQRKKYDLASIVNELLRVPGYCNHILAPQPALHVFGLQPEALLKRVRTLKLASETFTETYQVAGRTCTKRRRQTTPIALVAIASYPGPVTAPTAERNRWQQLVIEELQDRFETKLQAVYAHVDESCYHLHAFVDDEARPAKQLHAGHRAAARALAEGATRFQAKQAYDTAMRALQEHVHAAVAAPLGWCRAAPAPKNARHGLESELSAARMAAEADLVRRSEQLAQREAALDAKVARLRQLAAKTRAALLAQGITLNGDVSASPADLSGATAKPSRSRA